MTLLMTRLTRLTALTPLKKRIRASGLVLCLLPILVSLPSCAANETMSTPERRPASLVDLEPPPPPPVEVEPPPPVEVDPTPPVEVDPTPPVEEVEPPSPTPPRSSDPPDAVGEAPPAPRFPWPPPRASAWEVLDSTLLRKPGAEVTRLGDVDEKLSEALDGCGYFEKSYFAAGPPSVASPDGFALVTRLEQIHADGRPREGPDRWAADIGPLREFSLRDYLRALFTANPGHYRILVFIVSPHPFTQSPQTVDRDVAMGWLAQGANTLPDAIGRLEYGSDYKTTALVYEFEQPGRGEEADLKVPGLLTGRVHLEQSALLEALRR